jgi:uncharacterized protein YecE (DUF72 family)
MLMTIHVGTSGWSYGHWRGGFYPEKLAKTRWFDFYAEHFNAVEVNATFYRRFNDSTYRKWLDRAPENFRYVLKVPRLISHRDKLHDVVGLITEFTRSASLLSHKLGLLLLQLPPDMPYEPERLDNALQAFESPSLLAVEFRNERWMCEEILAMLRTRGVNYCNPDDPDHALSDIVTGDTGYLRLHGRRAWYADRYTDEELRDIAETARRMLQQGAKEVYVFFNNDYAAYAPDNAAALSRLV